MRVPTDKEFSMMIAEVRQWEHNGTRWPVAVGKVATVWRVDRQVFKDEIQRRRSAVARARAKKERVGV